MGTIAGMHVYGYRKPTLTLSLEAGGSLLANTRYYVVGFYAVTQNVYHNVGGPMSDVVSITTTNTHKSIRVSYKTYVDIQGFSDNGDGRTKVNATKHCVSAVGPDVIEIETGSYAGTHTVKEWVDYNNFIIDTPYIDTYTTTFYTDGDYNRLPYSYQSGTRNYMRFIYSDNPLYNSDGYFTPSYGISAYPYELIADKTLLSTKSNKFIAYGGNVDCLKQDNGLYRELKYDGGVVVQSSKFNTSLYDIRQEVQNSGFTKNCSLSSGGYRSGKTFFIHGTIHILASLGGTLSDSFASITILGGEIYGTGNFESMVLNYSSITSVPGLYSLYMKLSSIKGVFYNSAGENGIQGYFKGENVYGGTQRFQPSLGDEFTTYINQVSGITVNCSVIKNKEFLPTNSLQSAQVSYDTITFEGCKLFTIYHPGGGYIGGNNPSIYFYKNCYMFKSSGYEYHIRYYSYLPTYNNIYRGLNIDTDESDNKKIVVPFVVASNFEYNFYREVKINLKDEDGNPISGASLYGVDSVGNEYTATTDINGNGSIEYLEQKTKYLQSDGAMSTYNPAYYTYYSGVDVTISKDGYETIKLENIDSLRTTGAIQSNISMKTQVPLIVTPDNVYVKKNPENIGDNRNLAI